MPMSKPLQDKLMREVRAYLCDDHKAAMHLVGTGAVAELEKRLAALYGMKHALCVSNATAGLLALTLALELRGAEVISSPFSYGASLAGLLLLNVRPVFADVEAISLTLDPLSVRRRINRKTKAILAVDTFGHPSDREALRRLAEEYGLFYLADGAQSFGAARQGKPTNHLADALVVSFNNHKILSADEGGAVLTNDTDTHQKLIWWTQHPDRQRKELSLHLANEFAFNARIHPLAAIWANTAFDAALTALKEHQMRCFRIIAGLNEVGLTEPINFAAQKIEPAFFRLSAAWLNRPQNERLENELRKMGLHLRVAKNPMQLLYQQPAFIAQYLRYEKGSRLVPGPKNKRLSAFVC